MSCWPLQQNQNSPWLHQLQEVHPSHFYQALPVMSHHTVITTSYCKQRCAKEWTTQKSSFNPISVLTRSPFSPAGPCSPWSPTAPWSKSKVFNRNSLSDNMLWYNLESKFKCRTHIVALRSLQTLTSTDSLHTLREEIQSEAHLESQYLITSCPIAPRVNAKEKRT